MIKINCCPYCFNTNRALLYVASTASLSVRSAATFYVYCGDCGLRDPTKYSEDEAIEAFNELTNRQNK